jgi:predicted NUDIX family NTP pyrophosphohydrolase
MAKQAKQSAGLLLFRLTGDEPEVMLVHPGGPFWARKDAGAWSIPKGEFADEDPLEAAKREFFEETGLKLPAGTYEVLSPVRQKSGKLVYAWALEFDADVSVISSNKFETEWPPRSGLLEQFPEVDKAAWFRLSGAMEKIIPGQRDLLLQCAGLILKKYS